MHNTTHTVVVKKQNRGLGFLAGMIAIFLLVRWWLTGDLVNFASACSSAGTGEGDGFSSVTGTVLPLVIEIIVGLGVFLIAVGSSVWSIVWDMISGVMQMGRELHSTRSAESSASDSAMRSATDTAASQAGSTAGRQAVLTPKQALRSMNQRLMAVEDELFPPPPPEPTVAELQAELRELRSKVESGNPAVREDGDPAVIREDGIYRE